MNKVAVITGCNRGVGAGVRDVLLDNDYIVYGINKTPADATTRYNSDYMDIITKAEDFRSNDLENLPDSVDLLVLNAGIRRFSTIEELDINDWKASLETNLTGAFRVVQSILPYVRKAKGNIIFIGSHSEKYTFERGAAYCTTKGGLKEFSECLMLEERYNDVRVSYLSLGSIKNREHGGDESWKLTPREVGETVYGVASLPKNILVPYMDVRPIKPLRDSLSGIDRLQYV